MAHADPLAQLLDRMTATPALDKLSAFAAEWKAQEAQDRRDAEAEDERRYFARKEVAAEEHVAAERAERRRGGL